MTIEIKVPSPGESINEVQLSNWLVDDGSFVEKDQEIAEIDSDKATLSISAEMSGTITFKVAAGDTVAVGSVVATIVVGEGVKVTDQNKEEDASDKAVQKKPESKQKSNAETEAKSSIPKPETDGLLNLSPLARKIMENDNLSEAEMLDFFKHYRLSRKDVTFFQENKQGFQVPSVATPSKDQKSIGTDAWGGGRKEEWKKMTMLRKKLSERLVAVKNETAMLTTFNEVNMTPIIEIRNKYKEIFKTRHNIGLGFMSFFTKAVSEALHLFPQVNAQINGDEIILYNYADISIAVSGPKGLVVPVVRNAETLSLAQIEKTIKELATKARDNKLTLEEMSGGTFTITNGGVFGSMLSTPIINPPQSAILGMHNIIERPIAVNGKVEIHPMMYVALSYDHRIIDGRESVGFLVHVKEMLENPTKMLFGAKDPIEVLLDL
ncbi:MAG: dihydrolipoyllysine-residue succinyltransferase [Bacteroidetes bacterium HGW-Bacteroidetes-1]|jgi:2-oxoglutarate dehydrogenase E2 component (dihydrolipoamide succinyltransferase)|nr:MAG: dihydrolipoyllysine-residue succinyltransferase [Bacteroidetes bacterium HGW-Bacteroidetes-1]